MRQDFTMQELHGLEDSDQFFWAWVPAVGNSGGMLLGVRDSSFEVGEVQKGEFFISVRLFDRLKRIRCEFVGVYGPADHS
jgi:hypothetical protein